MERKCIRKKVKQKDVGGNEGEKGKGKRRHQERVRITWLRKWSRGEPLKGRRKWGKMSVKCERSGGGGGPYHVY